MKQVIRAGQYWYADLSPAIGGEIGGSRKCRIERKRGNLARVIPMVLGSNGSFVYNPWYARTIDISRLKEKVSG